MITHRLSPAGILTLHPSGSLSAGDFAAIATAVDKWLEEGNNLKGLLIDAGSFSGWKDFAALSAHLRFVKNHHKIVPRVAFLTDSAFLSSLPRVGRHFVNAEIRHFPTREREAALDWLNSPPADQPHALHQAWFPEHHLCWLRVNGRITSAEYKAWIADVESHINQHAPISFLIEIEDLQGVDLGAVLADIRFGLSHIQHIKRIALTGQQSWISKITSLPNPFPFDIKAFDEHSEFDAWSWITTP